MRQIVLFISKITVISNFVKRNHANSMVTSWLPHVSIMSPGTFSGVVTQNVIVSNQAIIISTYTYDNKIELKNLNYSLPVIMILLLIDTPRNPLMGTVGRSPTCLQEPEPETRTSVDTRLLEPYPPVTKYTWHWIKT